VPKAVQYTFTALFSRVVSEKRREQSAKRYKHAVPMPKWRYYLPGARKSSATATGDKRLHDLRAALSRLDGLGYRRSMHQVAFHEAFIGACIAQIYGDDLYRNIVRIMDENGFDELSTEISVICPRRWGKTTAVSLFVAALLYTQPAVDVAIYSVSRRASNSLLRKIFLILRKLWGDDLSSVVAFNQEELRVRTINGGESVVWSYPSNVTVRAFFLSLFFLSLSLSLSLSLRSMRAVCSSVATSPRYAIPFAPLFFIWRNTTRHEHNVNDAPVRREEGRPPEVGQRMGADLLRGPGGLRQAHGRMEPRGSGGQRRRAPHHDLHVPAMGQHCPTAIEARARPFY
jgi:hypothetical protein